MAGIWMKRTSAPGEGVAPGPGGPVGLAFPWEGLVPKWASPSFYPHTRWRPVL